MASSNNSFSLLNPGQQASLDPKKGSKKRQKKKASAKALASPDLPANDQPNSANPPEPSELEAMAKRCKIKGERMELMRGWVADLEANMSWVNSQGRPVTLRSQLLKCRALEICAEESLQDFGGVEEEALGRLLGLVFQFTEPGLVEKILEAARQVVSVLSGGEKFGAGRRCIGELVGSAKKGEVLAEESEEGKWSNGGKTKPDKGLGHQKAERKPNKGESRCDFDLSLALDELKSRQAALDQVREHFISANKTALSVTSSASQSIADLKTLMSVVCQADDGFNNVQKGKKVKKKGEKVVQAAGARESSQGFIAAAMEPYNKEAAALAEQEAQLSGEIAGLETKLTSLKSQLVAIKDAQAQLEQRKAVITNTAMPMSGVPLIPERDQAEIVGLMGEVLSELQSICSISNAERDDVVSAYREAALKALRNLNTKQEEVMKNVKFLTGAIHRKKQHEDQLMSMAAVGSREELLDSNRKQKEKLEIQLRDALQVALGLLDKGDKILAEGKMRKDVIDRGVEAFESLVASIHKMHSSIVAESSQKEKPRPAAAPAASPPPRKRFDASEIVKQAEREVAKEMSKGRRVGPSQSPTQQSKDHQAPGPRRVNGQGQTNPQAAPIGKPAKQPVGEPKPASQNPAYINPPQGQENQQVDGGSCVAGFGAESGGIPAVSIPNVEDEMVPPPVSDWSDGHFSPTIFGNGAHSQSPIVTPVVSAIAPPKQNVMNPQISGMTGVSPSLQPVANSPAMPVEPAHTYSNPAPKGWKKIDRVAGESGAISSDPTPAEAMKFAKSHK